MAGSWRVLLCVLAALALAVPSARGFGGRLGFWRGASSSQYAAPSASGAWAVPYYYCPPAPRVVPVPEVRPGMRYADPVPAPPSTPEPPLQKKAVGDPRLPIITAAHTFGDAPTPAIAKDRCKVAFWNLSGRELTLLIEGKTWTVAKDRSVRLDLGREFAWQIAGRPQTVERLPANQPTHDIVIRE